MTLPTPDTSHTSVSGQAREQPKVSGWWIGLLALLPIACCGLPLLLAAGFFAGTGALVGGVAGVVLLVPAAVLVVVMLRRRRNATGRTSAPPEPEPHRTTEGTS